MKTTKRNLLNRSQSLSTRPLLFLLYQLRPKRRSTPFLNTFILRKTQAKVTISLPNPALGNLMLKHPNLQPILLKF